MTIRRIVIAATVAASFSIAASAAPVAQPAPVDSKSTFTLIMTGKHTGYKHRGHWRYRHRREQNRDDAQGNRHLAHVHGITPRGTHDPIQRVNQVSDYGRQRGDRQKNPDAL